VSVAARAPTIEADRQTDPLPWRPWRYHALCCCERVLSTHTGELRLLRAARSRVVATWQQLHAADSLRVSLLYPPGPGPRLMSWLRKRWVIFRHPHAHLEFHGPVYLGPGFSLNMPHGGTFIVGPGVEFRRGFRAELGAPETRITIGRQSVFTYDAILQCTTSIDIGSYCAFGQASLVVDGNHRFRDLDQPVFDQGYEFRPVVISDHAVIGSKSTVIAASIGERTYISANSLVSKDIPAYCVVAGIPGRIIDYFGPPEQEPRIDRARRAQRRSSD